MATNASPRFGISRKIKQVGRMDLPGGGKVVVENGFAYVGHIDPPLGTSIIDVSDPKHPRIVAQLEVPEGIHSHKVTVSGDVMLVNYERYKTNKEAQGGLKIFDISNRAKPREIAFFKAAAKGVHRFTSDERYVYFSPVMGGYVGNIVMILDLKDPSRPEEVGRWWMPGQWVGGGETPSWDGTAHRCHHPIRKGDRLYVSYWHGGFVILDISDMSRPKLVSHVDWSPPYPSPTHTTLPMPGKFMGRDIMVVTDEEAHKLSPTPSAFLWVVDISDETRPIPVSTFIVPQDGESNHGSRFGAHQPAEQVYGNILYVTWFVAGLRAIDFSNPYLPTEVGTYIPLPGKGQKTVQSNDVFHRDDGLLFLIDRLDGLEILESEL
ncbi:MAG: LVIVD repeat-containing protein [Candidatus Binatia bacterium]